MHAELDHSQSPTHSEAGTPMPEGEEKPPRFTRAMAWVRWFLLAFALFAAVYTNVDYFFFDGGHASASAAKFYCPMHPQITSDRPGECPICHMSLEPIPTDRLTGGAEQAHQGHGHDHAAHGGEGAAEAKGKYICPMCPSVVSDGPGECPICHMSLEPAKPSGEAKADDAHGDESHADHAAHAEVKAPPVAKQAGHAEGAHAEHETSHDTSTRKGPKYTCPMHPEVVEDGPGRCPICRMYLEPVRDEASQAGEKGQVGMTPPGTVPVVLAFDRVQAIGVRTRPVTLHRASSPLKVTATIAAPEQGQAYVHTRAAGYVERASVQETGARVRRGQELVSLYSPEIYQAQAELLAARSWQGEGGAASRQVEAARTKLELLGVSSKAIDRILASGKPSRTVPIVSPIDGWVVKKSAVLGAYVTPEVTLFEIVDLSNVYVTAEVFQRDAHLVQKGSRARFLLAGREEGAVEGTIDLVYPTLSPKERTTRVRMQVKNRDGALRPGDYGSLEVASESRDSVVVPRDAIVDTGTVTYVFVVEGEGRYVPRTVSLGEDFDDLVEVKGGVHEGESVVSSATFLIDSESRLQASLAGHGGAHSSHASHGH